MPRQMFTDDLWLKLKAIMMTVGIYNKPFLRQTLEGIFYRLRVGYPWRDLPDYLVIGMPFISDSMSGLAKKS